MPAFHFMTITVLAASWLFGGRALSEMPVLEAFAYPCNSTDRLGVVVQACQPAQAHFFNSMAHINDVIRFPFEDSAGVVGHVMVQRHGFDEVGAWRMHHHFKMQPGEYLISQAQHLADGTVKHVASVKTSLDLKGQTLIPLAFAYSSLDHLWWPMQFYAFADHEHIGNQLARRYLELNSESGLMALGQLGQALLTAGLNKRIGISIPWGDLFGGVPGAVLLETTNETGRSQEFTLQHHGRAKQHVSTHKFFMQECEATPEPIRHGCQAGYECYTQIICDPVGDAHDAQDHHYGRPTHDSIPDSDA